jgi:hypothetical protein
MYFGLTNAPPFFQRTMNHDFAPLLQKYPDELGNYMDDWWITTTDDNEGRRRHKEITHAFLDCMEECSYFLKTLKVSVQDNNYEDLGMDSWGGQVHINPTKVKGISKWPQKLSTVKQVHQILGLLGYQCLFICSFAQIAHPLHNLTKTKTSMPFQWMEECTVALNQLIKQVTSEPVLHHPDPSQPFELWANTLTYALGAVLAQ